MKVNIIGIDTVSLGDIIYPKMDDVCELHIYDVMSDEDALKVSLDCDGLIINKTNVTKEFISQCKNLKYIGLFATGYNNVDVVEAHKRGIVVCNVPNYSTMGVAQLTFSFILQFATNLIKYNESTHAGDWIRSKTFSYFPYPIMELNGKTLGIIGYGSIGKQVKKQAEAFGMNVLVHTRTNPKDGTENVPLEVLLKNSDFVSVHCPLNSDTKYLINESTLAQMKKTAYLINCARRGIVDEKALINALNNGIIAGAALDTISKEPMDKDSELINAKNCIMTPHVAWAGLETRQRLVDIALGNLRAFIEGKPTNEVPYV